MQNIKTEEISFIVLQKMSVQADKREKKDVIKNTSKVTHVTE